MKFKNRSKKMKKIAITAIIACLSSFANANAVYSPEQGVICDKKSGFCSDSYGISLGLTKDFLGQKAADKMTKILSDKDFDATFYTMMNGLTCDTKKKICKKSKWDEKADAHWTAVLFGKKSAHPEKDAGPDLIQVAKDCKVYLAYKFDLPMSAFSVSKGHSSHGAIVVPVNINWDEPYVRESGQCKVVYGIVKSYKRTSE